MLFYFVLGCLFVGIQLLIRMKLSSIGKAKLWPNCVLVLMSNALILFSVAWAYASVLEHEMQAAMMGLLCFGGPGVVAAIFAYRAITNKEDVSIKVSDSK